MNSILLAPLLTEKSSTRDDYDNAFYVPDVNASSDTHLQIEHRIQGQTPLAALVEGGKARYVAEIRVPLILWSSLECSGSPLQTVALPCGSTLPPDWSVYVIPGIVASEDCDIPVGHLNSHIWDNSQSVVVPKGRWLAKGEIRSVVSCTSALMSFERRSDLPDGAMDVYQRQDEDNPTFVVQLGEASYPRSKTSRDVQIAGLVAVCSKLPRSTFGRDTGQHWDHEIAQHLRGKLAQANVPDWSEEGWNPARAATALEPFLPAPKDDSDD